MNMMIGLCRDVPKWPNTLKQENYQIECIEANIPQSKPDLILSNHQKNHSLFVDCKSKTLERKQIENYDHIQKNPHLVIQSGKVKTPHPQQFQLDPTLCSFSDLSAEPLVTEFNFPCLHVVESKQKPTIIDQISLNTGRFKNSKVNTVFPIDTSHCVPPVFLYPFSDLDVEIFTIRILQYLHQTGIKKKTFTVEDMLFKIHGMWKYIDNQKIFKTKASSILIDLQNKGLKKYLKRQNNEWSVDIKTDNKSHQAFQKKCIEIERELERKSYQDVLSLEI